MYSMFIPESRQLPCGRIMCRAEKSIALCGASYDYDEKQNKENKKIEKRIRLETGYAKVNEKISKIIDNNQASENGCLLESKLSVKKELQVWRHGCHYFNYNFSHADLVVVGVFASVCRFNGK